MKEKTVAIQGEHGAYSEAAAIEHLGKKIKTLPCKTFEDVFDAVVEEKANYGALPIENSLTGSIHRNFDLLQRHELTIISEYHLRIRHCLLGLPDSQLEFIQRVYSHPVALGQCEESLNELGVEMIAEYDTAGSARLIKEKNDPHAAAIASRHNSEMLGLKVLKEDLEDNSENYTRFLFLSKEPVKVSDPEKVNQDFKTSIVFSLDNEPGVLFKTLSVFALRDIDLTKIESRPLVGKPWEYLFYIDFIGHIESETSRRALRHLEEIAPFIRILGSYKRHRMS
jgi:prephenate dehydratase